MAQNKKNPNHAEFLLVAEEIKRKLQSPGAIELTVAEAMTIAVHGEWFADYLEGRARAGHKTINPGRKALPDGEITESTKRVRDWRAKKAELLKQYEDAGDAETSS